MLREEKYRSILPQDTFSICDFISGPIARKQVTLQTRKKLTKNRKFVKRWELEIVRNRRKNVMWCAHAIEQKVNAYDIEYPCGK